MRVIPAVNEKTFAETKSRLKEAIELVKDLPESERWIHIDVTNGTFTPISFWHDVREFTELKKLATEAKVKVGIHLMVARPEWSMGDWLQAGADSVIIHHEAMEFKESSMMLGDSVVLAIAPKTSVKTLIACSEYVKQVLILSVEPGLSGQLFDSETPNKILALRKVFPDVTISVDGGINIETGKLCKDAGADTLVSASYIWNGDNPKDAFNKLRSI
jgi:ribulose-phosphate 3-epimerase